MKEIWTRAERSGWRDYARFVEHASTAGYAIRGLEEWILDGKAASDEATLILRHDVDQLPASALRAAAIEAEYGARGTWYFRWRTAHESVIAHLRAAGAEVGLHYETLTRAARESGRAEADPELIDRCREALRDEIARFGELFGPIRSICAHGDTRVPRVNNLALAQGQDIRRFGVELDANVAIPHRALSQWVTDRRAADGRWGKGVDPHELLDARATPLLVVMHPNNWASSPQLWLDRLAAAVPLRVAGRPVASGREAPPSRRGAGR